MKNYYFVLMAFLTFSVYVAGQNIHFVENSNDDGPGSLRQIIEESLSGDTIKFTPGITTVNLESGELIITKTLSIVADSNVTILRIGNNLFRIIWVQGNNVITLYLKNIRIFNGTVQFNTEFMHGGGIFMQAQNSRLILENCIIENNKAGNGYYTYWNGGKGGGIFANFAKIKNCIIINNMAGSGADDNTNPNNPNGEGGDGGGIYCDSGLIINSLIYNNYSGNGGGGYWYDNDGGDGGGIYIKSWGKITNSTICFNTAREGGFEPSPGGDGNPGRGGGVFLENNYGLTLTNSIISNNVSVGDYLGNDLFGSFIANYNLVYDTSDYTLNGDNNILGVSPEFNDPSNDLTLSSNSPAINSGSPDTTGLLLPQVDLLGNLRITGDTVDIGAYEYQYITAVSSLDKINPIVIFPNPNNGKFWISGENGYLKSLEVYNLLGKKIKEIKPDIQPYHINISDCPKGIYIIVIKNGADIYSEKVVIR